MKKYYLKNIQQPRLESIACNVCQKTYNDEFEMAECYNINFTGGYNSIFGDGNKIDVDICQYCLNDILRKYIKL